MTVHSPSIVCSEGIYENAAVLKSSSMASPVTTALEKYEFGQEILHDDSQDDSHESPGEKETLSDDPEERSSDQEAVSFQVTVDHWGTVIGLSHCVSHHPGLNQDNNYTPQHGPN